MNKALRQMFRLNLFLTVLPKAAAFRRVTVISKGFRKLIITLWAGNITTTKRSIRDTLQLQTSHLSNCAPRNTKRKY